MDLFHFVTPSKLENGERSKSEDRDPVAPPRGMRKTSLPAHAHANKKMSK